MINDVIPQKDFLSAYDRLRLRDVAPDVARAFAPYADTAKHPPEAIAYIDGRFLHMALVIRMGDPNPQPEWYPIHSLCAYRISSQVPVNLILLGWAEDMAEAQQCPKDVAEAIAGHLINDTEDYEVF